MEMRPMRCLSPLQSAFGVSPSEAANWRPDVNWCGSVTEAASADAVMKPIPGMVFSRLASSLPRNQDFISSSSVAMRACNARICSAKEMTILQASAGMSGARPSTS